MAKPPKEQRPCSRPALAPSRWQLRVAPLTLGHWRGQDWEGEDAALQHLLSGSTGGQQERDRRLHSHLLQWKGAGVATAKRTLPATVLS